MEQRPPFDPGAVNDSPDDEIAPMIGAARRPDGVTPPPPPAAEAKLSAAERDSWSLGPEREQAAGEE